MLIRFWVALLLALAVVLSAGCDVRNGTSYDMSWLMGASSTFEASTEGAIEGSMAGTATFRADAEGRLVGVDLVHIDDSTRGISIELEPRPPAARTYEVIAPGLLEVERSDSLAGFTAFFESSTRSFQATRGTLQITAADASEAYGTFDIEMEGRGGILDEGLTVQGSFQATRAPD